MINLDLYKDREKCQKSTSNNKFMNSVAGIWGWYQIRDWMYTITVKINFMKCRYRYNIHVIILSYLFRRDNLHVIIILPGKEIL